MDEAKKNSLKKAGIQVEDALGRFMGNEKLLERFLLKFLDDRNYEQLKAAIEEKDRETELRCSHTLKGVWGAPRSLHRRGSEEEGNSQD